MRSAHKSTIAALVVTLCLVLSVKSATATAESQIAARFENIASKLQFFLLSDFLYGREGSTIEAEQSALVKYQELLNEALSSKYKVNDLLPLLKHKNPRVRTLAIAALYNKEDVRALPYLVPLVDDKAQTYKSFSPKAFINPPAPSVPDEAQTVGFIADKCLAFYMEKAGYVYGPKARPDVHLSPNVSYGGFDDYWNKRKGRQHCASWFEVRIDRAYGGITDVRPECIPKVKTVVDEIIKLPEPDRLDNLLYLSTNAGAKTVIDEALLLKESKSVKREHLLNILKRQNDCKDPDVHTRYSSNFCYTSMMNFILSNAGQLLKSEDIPILIACDRSEYDTKQTITIDRNQTALWLIAVARLDKEHAKTILMDRIKRESNIEYRSENCALLAEAIAEILGPSEDPFLVNYFYSATAKDKLTEFQQAFISKLTRLNHARRQQVLKAIVADKRYPAVHIWTMMAVVENFGLELGEKKKHELWSRLQQLNWSLLDQRNAKQYPNEARKLHEDIEQITKEFKSGIGL